MSVEILYLLFATLCVLFMNYDFGDYNEEEINETFAI